MAIEKNKSSFQYPKGLEKGFHYPARLDGSIPTTEEGPHQPQTCKKNFGLASFNHLLDGADLLNGENCFRIDHSPRAERLDSVKESMSIDHILEHVQEWKAEFGITEDAPTDDTAPTKDSAPISPRSFTGSAGSRLAYHSSSGGNNNKYDVTRSLRKKGSGPPAAAATLLSAHAAGKATRRSSNQSAPVNSEPSLPTREIPERALSFTQLAGRPRKTSFSELAAKRGVKW